MLTKELTVEVLNAMYESSLKFWQREVTQELIDEGYPPERLAFMETQKIKHDPFSPNGKKLNEESKVQWVITKNEELKQSKELVVC